MGLVQDEYIVMITPSVLLKYCLMVLSDYRERVWFGQEDEMSCESSYRFGLRSNNILIILFIYSVIIIIESTSWKYNIR